MKNRSDDAVNYGFGHDVDLHTKTPSSQDRHPLQGRSAQESQSGAPYERIKILKLVTSSIQNQVLFANITSSAQMKMRSLFLVVDAVSRCEKRQRADKGGSAQKINLKIIMIT